jgi:hypothetical protein
MPDVHVGMRVTIERRTEYFIVLRIDRERNLADLMRLGPLRKVENGIPLALLRPAPDGKSRDDERVSA